MEETILKVENISKQYRLGLVGTGTISHDLNRWWYRVRGKDDPFLKVGELNDRSTKGTSDYVWALKDISFEVKKGEVLGIIGMNGAGKSTLLKILSRVTSPSTGIIKSKGRIASLLEVGTGFHPEMTGRENIYLNGAILGMTKSEIRSKIDEIIAFSGCERYIDTPVKRYSSGMTVRLAFSVAAHLEPDILVVDEVLAVGDAEFQKKAVGKMQEISKGQGRTILFVSHNMTAIKNICTKCLLIENGSISVIGAVKDVINQYTIGLSVDQTSVKLPLPNKYDNLKAGITSIKLNSNDDGFFIEENLDLEVKFKNLVENQKLNISISVFNEDDVYIFSSPNLKRESLSIGEYKNVCRIPGDTLNIGKYFFTILLIGENYEIISQLDKIVSVNMQERGLKRGNYFGSWNGVVRPILKWTNSKL